MGTGGATAGAGVGAAEIVVVVVACTALLCVGRALATAGADGVVPELTRCISAVSGTTAAGAVRAVSGMVAMLEGIGAGGAGACVQAVKRTIVPARNRMRIRKGLLIKH